MAKENGAVGKDDVVHVTDGKRMKWDKEKGKYVCKRKDCGHEATQEEVGNAWFQKMPKPVEIKEEPVKQKPGKAVKQEPNPEPEAVKPEEKKEEEKPAKKKVNGNGKKKAAAAENTGSEEVK